MEPNSPLSGIERLEMLCQAADELKAKASLKETIETRIRAQEAGSGLKVGPPPNVSQGFRNREYGRNDGSNGYVEQQYPCLSRPLYTADAANDSCNDTIVESDSDADGTISGAGSDNDLPKCSNRACRYQGEEIDPRNPTTCPVCSLLYLKYNIDMGGRDSKRSSRASTSEEPMMNEAKKEAADSLEILRRSTSGSPNSMTMESHGHPPSTINDEIPSRASTESNMSWGPYGRAGQTKTTEDTELVAGQSSLSLSQPEGIAAMSPESMESPENEMVTSEDPDPVQHLTPSEGNDSNIIETDPLKSPHKGLASNINQQPADTNPGPNVQEQPDQGKYQSFTSPSIEKTIPSQDNKQHKNHSQSASSVPAEHYNLSRLPRRDLQSNGNGNQHLVDTKKDVPESPSKRRTSSVRMTSQDRAKPPKLNLKTNYKGRDFDWPKGRAYNDKDVQAEARKFYARREKIPELEESDNDVPDEYNPRIFRRRRARTPVDDYPIPVHDDMSIAPHDNEYFGALSGKLVKNTPYEYIRARANTLWDLEIDRLMERHREILQREQDIEMVGGPSTAMGSPGKHRDSGSRVQPTRQQKRQRVSQDGNMI